ncbi:YeeE/YedE family protein [Methanolacinia petrolearia DSM 11571]|uniref:YeeE/YedE family protein n=1 Tax=Methanolacinia petrolearia (strain DSM 11571 / OCM 486 / SEBR 4847) TaxID=679926 RepID=E1RJJ2_METP4|nr:YeeE/YedE thiosulfate transporter family protein [Methanolacinia petrolearia]ADN36798.1 YeeE/YedE family protein [Methanolacinia petrolearia DSM 11571]
MLTETRKNKRLQLFIGFIIGLLFGLFLYIGGVTEYNVIIGQLLLTDFTVLKVIMTAIVVGMPGIYIMKGKGLVSLHVRKGSVGSTVIGGLIFGIGFAILGYCPGTVAGAAGHGSMDALFGGIVGILIGTWIFGSLYPALNKKILNRGEFRHMTIPEKFGVNPWFVVIPAVIFIALVLASLEYTGY